MAISKLDLRLGNLFEQGIVCKISGRTGAKIHLHGRARYKGGLKIRHEHLVGELVPILLTPKILVDWCGFDKIDDVRYGNDELDLMFADGFIYGDGYRINYLHELQNLYYALNKKELEIKG